MEPIFIAANTREVDFLEKLLDEAGVDYEVRPEAFKHAITGACYQGLMFEVAPGVADRCRELIRERGLERGIV